MRTVPYKTVLRAWSQLAFGKDSPGREDAATFNTFFQEAVAICWRRFWWPELMKSEQRQLRDTWATISYAIGAEVYFPQNQTYYYSLQNTNSVIPASLTGTEWVDNDSYWIQVQDDWSGQDWQPSTAYIVGDIVRYPADGKFYVAIHSHTSSGLGISSTNFTVLKRFKRALRQTGQAAMDAIEGVYDDDPDINPDACRLDFELSEEVLIHDLAPTFWIKYRQIIPDWSGDLYEAGTNYSAGAQTYYNGDYYRANINTTQAPTTSDWTLIGVPYYFRQALPRLTHSAWLESEGQQDKARVSRDIGVNQLNEEITLIQRRQRQSRSLNVRNS